MDVEAWRDVSRQQDTAELPAHSIFDTRPLAQGRRAMFTSRELRPRVTCLSRQLLGE